MSHATGMRGLCSARRQQRHLQIALHFISVGLPRTRLVAWLPSSFIPYAQSRCSCVFVFMRLCAAARSH